MFQYISWVNSVRVQKATERVERASNLYRKLAEAVSGRYYATLLFIPAIRNIATSSTTTESGLSKLLKQRDKKRIDLYYSKLKEWNEQYDIILTEIEYILDRPIFRQANEPYSGIIRSAKINAVDCKLFLPEQMEKTKLEKHSLKVHFAVINNCFRRLNKEIAGRLKNPVNLDNNFEEDINKKLEAVHTMANVFRCYALRRIEYYYSERQSTIISLGNIATALQPSSLKRAKEQLESADAPCGAGQFRNMCSMGLARGKDIQTECSINTVLKGKTYCFESKEAMAMFIKHPEENVAKAEDYYSKNHLLAASTFAVESTPQPLTRADCEKARMQWNDDANVCGGKF